MPNITQRIVLEGADAIKSAFVQIGTAGKAAFDGIAAAAAKVAPVFASVEASSIALSKNLQTVAAQSQLTGNQLVQIARTGGTAFQTIAADTGKAIGPISSIGVAVRRLLPDFSNSGNALREFGHVMHGIGRATGASEISHLGHTVSLLGRAFGALALPLIAFGFGKVASSAANAALGFEKLEAQNKKTKEALEETLSTANDRLGQLQTEKLANWVQFQSNLTSELHKGSGAFIQFDSEQSKFNNEISRANAEVRKAAQALEEHKRKVDDDTRAMQQLNQQQPFTGSEIALARDFKHALEDVEAAFSDLRNKMGLAVAPIFIQAFEELKAVISANRDTIVAWGQALASGAIPLLKSLIGIIFAFGTGLSGVVSLFQAFVNGLGGANLNKAQAFAALLIAIALAFGGWPIVIAATLTLLGKLWPEIEQGFGKVKDWIVNAWKAANDAVQQFIDNTLSIFKGWYDTIAGWIKSLVDSFKDLLGLQGQSASDTGSSDSGFAGGGYVRGPGTGTSDSILGRLSNGEFVVRSAAVSRYGVGFMSAVNNMRFAMGGLVGLPRFASGGPVSGSGGQALHPVSIHLGGDSIHGLLAPPDVASRLVEVATAQRIKRAGRKPGWVG